MTNTNNTEKRLTKAMKFADVKSMLLGEEPVNGLTVEDGVNFIESEMELLAKKNSSSKNDESKNAEREANKALLLEFLSAQLEPVTCTDIVKGIPEFADRQNQFAARLVNDLFKEGKVVKAKSKGRTVVSIA